MSEFRRRDGAPSFLAITVMVIALCGCVSQAEQQARADTADDARCVSYGLTMGTPAYSQCRMAIAQQRQAAALAVLGMMQANRPTIPLYQIPVTQPAPPVTTVCNTNGNQTACYSH